jgi:cell division protein FtsB
MLPLLTSGVLAYFSHHAVNGSLGLVSKQKYEQQIEFLQAELANVEGVRLALEKKTAMLRNGSLERDMIDEQARRLLGVTRANEIVVLHR